ncbi:MAG: hypothetical protein ACPGVT_11355 [Maricaulaceae bacterium]
MRFHLLSLLLALFACVLAIFVGAGYLRNRPQPPEPVAKSDTGPEIRPVGAVTPALFKTVTEEEGLLRMGGTSEPNIVLSILQNGQKLREVEVDEEGVWSFSLPVMNEDIQVIDLVMYLENGARIRSDETIFRIPYKMPDVPEEVSEEDGDVEEQLADEGAAILEDAMIEEVLGGNEDVPQLPKMQSLLLIATPGGPSRIIKSPFGELPSMGALTLGPVDYDDSGGALFSGTSSEPGRVGIYVGNSFIGEAVIADDGKWFFIVSETLPLGTYTLSFELIRDEAKGERLMVPFERLAPTNARINSGRVFVRYKAEAWQMRRPLLGGGAQYTAVFAPIEAPQMEGEP